ncbi:lipoprotein insertase outer membrane protein LolB [Variovorax sp. RHLX14]|uniref:lipoprotein insertase outer membrane protein LolB n=1 Tax=Variovorax sp. RHLX14 TaxID=1259731 RepID=UPI003F488CD8
MRSRRNILAMAGAALGLLVAGCATPRQSVDTTTSIRESWSGRLSLRVEGEASQSFAALFDLRGAPERGTLTLTSPIGSTLAELRWTPTEALLLNGSQTRRFESVDALVLAATGAAVPVRALFAWLDGRDEGVSGWRADLSQLASGRLNAVRETPSPRAELRVIFDRQ